MHTLRIMLKLCELNFKRLLLFRASFIISLMLMTAWVGAYIVLIETIFYHTPELAGFSKGEVLLVMGFYYLVQNLSDIFFKDNFEDFGETVRRGGLDLKLTKPASPRLLSFFWEIRFDHIAGLILTGFLFIYAFTEMVRPISILFFTVALLMSLISTVLNYSILSLIATLTFWVTRNETFNVLIFNVSQLARYPRQIYSGAVGKVLTFGIPLALISSIPAEIALDIAPPSLVLFFIAITAFFYLVSRIIWNIGLRRYTSAS